MVHFVFFRVRAVRNKHHGSHMTCNAVFIVFWDPLLTNCDSCSFGPNPHHPATCSLPMCENTRGVLRDFVLVVHRDIRREHSPIGRRNCLMTEAANSLSTDEGPEFPIKRTPIANLASDEATGGLAWVRVCAVWRPGASVGRTQSARSLIYTTSCVGMISTRPRFR